MKIVSYGGGTNSTAMLIGLIERQEKVDFILFADTGGEKPHTYTYVDMFSEWLKDHGMPESITVSNLPTLEADCLTRGALPSVAYGFKSCSDRWKIRPQNKYLKEHGIKVTQRLIGFDADEPQRAKEIEGNRYPLLEWDWGRDECIKAIKDAGLPSPGKSSCYFCPSSKKHEILQLARMYPDLAERAVAMEKNAELTQVKGLGRNYAWGDLLNAEEEQVQMFPESYVGIDCGCYDGD